MRGAWDGDRDPLLALRRGEPRLFEDFVRMEAATFVGFFERLGAGRSEAEDLAQEVFLRLFQRARAYQPRGVFTGYALRIARNAWIDACRRHALRRLDADSAIEASLAPAPTAGPGAETETAEESQRALRALGELSEGHRMVFELAVMQGRPYPEIAALLEIPVGTVKSRVFHALRKLRAALDETAEEREA